MVVILEILYLNMTTMVLYCIDIPSNVSVTTGIYPNNKWWSCHSSTKMNDLHMDIEERIKKIYD